MSWRVESDAVGCYCCDCGSSRLAVNLRWHSRPRWAAESEAASGVCSWIKFLSGFLFSFVFLSPTYDAFCVCKLKECIQLYKSEKKATLATIFVQWGWDTIATWQWIVRLVLYCELSHQHYPNRSRKKKDKKFQNQRMTKRMLIVIDICRKEKTALAEC